MPWKPSGEQLSLLENFKLHTEDMTFDLSLKG